jgi:type 1 glutamine amidotransferase
LLSIDTARTDLRQGNYCAECERDDNDYAISWVRRYDKGRVFFANFGNGGEVFSDSRILEHFLAGIQFVLGDLEVDTTPSAKTGARTAASK